VTGDWAVITRDDGTYQVTVNGMPLYTYAKDTKAGDVVGQAVGDVWWVVSADGKKIDKQ
jgi:predicted lipoprotein with Yx(FWY)xxD motif